MSEAMSNTTVEVDASVLAGVLSKLGMVQPIVESEEQALVHHQETLTRDIIAACDALNEQTDMNGLMRDFNEHAWTLHGPGTSLPIDWVAEHRTETHDIECGTCFSTVPVNDLVDVHPRDNLPGYNPRITERTPVCNDCRDRFDYEPVEPTFPCIGCDSETAMSDSRTLPQSREKRHLHSTVCTDCAASAVYLTDLKNTRR